MKNIVNSLIKRKIITAFDSWSPSYSNDVIPKLVKRGYGYDKLAEKIVTFLSPPQYAEVLEFGVGSGVLGQAMFNLRPDLVIIGIDISRGMLSQARKISAYQHLIQCDAERIPLISQRYQYAYSAFMMHSLPNLQSFLNETRRIMQTQARIGLIDLFKFSRRHILSKLIDNIHSYRYEHGAPSNYHTSEEFLQVLKKSNIIVTEQSTLDANETISGSSAGAMEHYFFGLSV